MKKFFEKHELIKISGILIIFTVLLTWLVPYGYFSGSEMVVEKITRIGLTDFMQYGLLGMYYFTVLITFLFILGGFYQVLSKTKGYNKLVIVSGKLIEGKEKLFLIGVSIFFAILSSLMNEYFPLLILIPFVISIMNKLKVDKVVAFTSTFGSMLVGLLGSTYSGKVLNFINTTFQTDYKTNIICKIALLVMGVILINILNIVRLSKTSNKNKFENYDKFEIKTESNSKEKTTLWPYVIGLLLITVTTVLAYLPWDVWKVTIFKDITKWVNELSLFNVPIVSYIFSEFKSFGSWDIFTIQFVMLFATLLIHWFAKVSWDDIFESYGEGFKKISYTVVILLLVYMVLEFAIMFPVIPVLVDKIAKLSSGFNVLLASLATFITSIFGVEMQYVMNLSGTYLAVNFAENKELLAMLAQTIFGLVSFVVPSSAIMMIGLSYMNISYKDWLKHIWKFLIAMLLVIIVIIMIVM